MRGCIVTIDAMRCQREIARQIVAQGGDYVLALRGNQSGLDEDVRLFLDDDAREQDFVGVTHHPHRTFAAEYGRQETWRYRIGGEVAWLQERHDATAWAGLTSIGMVETQRRAGGPGTPGTVKRRYYISSLAANPRECGPLRDRRPGAPGIEDSVH